MLKLLLTCLVLSIEGHAPLIDRVHDIAIDFDERGHSEHEMFVVALASVWAARESELVPLERYAVTFLAIAKAESQFTLRPPRRGGGWGLFQIISPEGWDRPAGLELEADPFLNAEWAGWVYAEQRRYCIRAKGRGTYVSSVDACGLVWYNGNRKLMYDPVTKTDRKVMHIYRDKVMRYRKRMLSRFGRVAKFLLDAGGRISI